MTATVMIIAMTIIMIISIRMIILMIIILITMMILILIKIMILLSTINVMVILLMKYNNSKDIDDNGDNKW